MQVTEVRNVNEALVNLIDMAARKSFWRIVSPRGNRTMELMEPHATVYTHPKERVLFSAVRDANPFFHLMEALWIMAGREDVAFLARFNSQMRQFSDNGETFHAPYGYRLRKWLTRDKEGKEFFSDQILGVVELLRKEPDTRRAVMSIWNPYLDLGTKSADVPCNSLITFKLRNNVLNITVMCRSNDALLGVCGANAVQFSFLQEFVALAIGATVGTYTQISDSYHIYTDSEVWKRLENRRMPSDPYVDNVVTTYPIMDKGTAYYEWLRQCEAFCEGVPYKDTHDIDPFFTEVAGPVRHAWSCYKEDTTGFGIDKNTRIDAALQALESCQASDWATACAEWLVRRRNA